MLNAGIPLLRALELIRRRSDSRVGKVCSDIIVNLRRGSSLAEAMAADKRFFSDLAVTLAAAGEQSGELNRILQETAFYYNKQYEMRNFLYKAAVYPLFLLMTSFCILLFFILYVLPLLAGVYISMNVRPDGFLLAALTAGDFLSSYGYLAALVVVGAGVYFKRNPRLVKESILKLPVINGLYAAVLEARFCKLLALLLNSGIGITEAVDMAGNTVGNIKWQRELRLFNNYLKKGMDIGAAAKRAGNIFTPLTIEFIVVGAATGSLPQMLEEAAAILEQDLRDRLERLRELLTPILILAASLVTGVIVCAVIAPLFDLFTALPEYN